MIGLNWLDVEIYGPRVVVLALEAGGALRKRKKRPIFVPRRRPKIALFTFLFTYQQHHKRLAYALAELKNHKLDSLHLLLILRNIKDTQKLLKEALSLHYELSHVSKISHLLEMRFEQ